MKRLYTVLIVMLLICGCSTQVDSTASVEKNADASNEVSRLSKINITLLTDDVSEESINSIQI